MSEIPPVAVFGYRRPELLRRVLESCFQNDVPKIYVFLDGPKDESQNELEATSQCRDVANLKQWAPEVNVFASRQNQGLRNSVIAGLDRVFAEEDFAIILEDDCLPCDAFFSYSAGVMNRGRSPDSIGMFTGNNYGFQCSWRRCFLASSPRIWGWGTWGEVWRSFSIWLTKDHEITEILSTRNVHFASPLERARVIRFSEDQTLDTWDTHFLVFMKLSRLTSITPPWNLVQNLGMASGATHTQVADPGVNVLATNFTVPIESSDLRLRRWYELEEDAAKLLRRAVYAIQHPVRALQVGATKIGTHPSLRTSSEH